MIQLNLLPDVKMEYLKAQRSRRLVLTVAVLVTATALVLLVLLLGVDGLQKKHLSDLNRDISSETSRLQNEPQIGQVLTVQNQLESLTALHSSKPAASRVFDYLNEVTPAVISISSFNIDFGKQTVTITGTADALSSINQYVDTLKYTAYTTDTNKTPAPAFNSVVLSNFSRDTNAQNNGQLASYTITFSYDKTIFDITQKVNLTVPNLVTRLGLQQPTDLFQSTGSGSSSAGGGQ